MTCDLFWMSKFPCLLHDSQQKRFNLEETAGTTGDGPGGNLAVLPSASCFNTQAAVQLALWYR